MESRSRVGGRYKKPRQNYGKCHLERIGAKEGSETRRKKCYRYQCMGSVSGQMRAGRICQISQRNQSDLKEDRPLGLATVGDPGSMEELTHNPDFSGPHREW